jgi:selenocysteine-specific elongation factor
MVPNSTLKVRTGAVDRVMDDYTVVGRTLFSKDTALEKFVGLKVRCVCTCAH